MSSIIYFFTSAEYLPRSFINIQPLIVRVCVCVRAHKHTNTHNNAFGGKTNPIPTGMVLDFRISVIWEMCNQYNPH